MNPLRVALWWRWSFFRKAGSLAFILVFCAGCQIRELTSAKVHIRQNQWDKAMAELEKAVAEHPENAEARFLLGQGYAAQKRFADMNRAFAASVAASPQFALEIKTWRQKYFSEYFNAGVKATSENNISAARDNFATAAVIDPQQPEVYRRLADVYAKSGEFEKALRLYQSALENNPDDWEAYLNIAELYTQQHDYEKSSAVLERALRQYPRQSQVLAALASVYDCLGKSEDALAAYQQALQNQPGDKELLLNLARVYLARNDYPHAIQQYAIVLSFDPDNFAANYNAGLVYLKMGERSQKLARALEKQNSAGLESKPIPQVPADSSKTKLNLEATRNFKTAIPFLLKAAKQDTLHAGAYFNLGVGFTRLGETEKAKEAFKRYEQLQEKNNQAEPPQ